MLLQIFGRTITLLAILNHIVVGWAVVDSLISTEAAIMLFQPCRVAKPKDVFLLDLWDADPLVQGSQILFHWLNICEYAPTGRSGSLGCLASKRHVFWERMLFQLSLFV